MMAKTQRSRRSSVEGERESKLRHTTIKRANLMASRLRGSRGHGDREAEAACYTTNFVSFLRTRTGDSSYSGADDDGDGGHNADPRSGAGYDGGAAAA